MTLHQHQLPNNGAEFSHLCAAGSTSGQRPRDLAYLSWSADGVHGRAEPEKQALVSAAQPAPGHSVDRGIVQPLTSSTAVRATATWEAQFLAYGLDRHLSQRVDLDGIHVHGPESVLVGEQPG